MTFEDIFAIDTSNMYGHIKGFPAQAQEALAIGKAGGVRLNAKSFQHVVLSGLGGSAIGGDLLRAYLAGELAIPFYVNRHYTLPAFVGPKSLVIVSSYSGDTEESLAAFKEAVKRRSKIVCISSNGKLEKLAKAKRLPFIKVPGGLPPRAALGYSFFPLLLLFMKAGLIKNKNREINETVSLLTELAEEYGIPDPGTNHAVQLATQLKGRIGIVYSSTERMDAVNTRWRGQLAENAKTLAFGNVLPEMNHNELVGWKVLKEQMREMQVLFLCDRDDHPRVRLRMDVTRGVLGEYTTRISDVRSRGHSTLARMFSLIYLGDWVSYYLAILNGEDPTPVRVIDSLKEKLASTKQ